MNLIADCVPAVALFICAVLYILEDKSKRKWIFSVASIAAQVFIIVYFLLMEAGMETLLLFLMASLALAVSVRPPKR